MTLLAKIESAGFTLTADGDRLLVSPASQLTAEQREKIRLNKTALLTAVQTRRLDELVCGRPPPLSPVGWVVDTSAGSDPPAAADGAGESPAPQPATANAGSGFWE